MRWARYVSAYSSTIEIGIVVELSDRYRMGESAGLTFRNVGGLGIPGGNCDSVAVIAACTSCAAASILRERLNCSVMDVDPWMLVEVIESRPAMVVNCFSSGVAIDEAIVSGFAPGNDACTSIVGKSTFGRSFTGSIRYAINPNNTIASEHSVVITGRRMKRSAMLTTPLLSFRRARA